MVLKKNLFLIIFMVLTTISKSQQISVEEFAIGFQEPLNIQNAGDERLFILEKSGFVYRGNKYSDIAGLYFFADGNGTIGSIDENNNLLNYGIIESSWTSFGIDINNEIYLTRYSGSVYKLKGSVLNIDDSAIKTLAIK
ncbi:MAG: hypothetical protein ACI9M9_001164 [Flavobacteriaceae bacterium]|jgi:hypothetical protein